MKRTICVWIFAALPWLATADIANDMEDPALSLTDVIRNASREGMPPDLIVAVMIDESPALSNAIVAAGITWAPDHYESIISAAITEGVDPVSLVATALVSAANASEDEKFCERASGIVVTAVRAAPASAEQAVIEAARQPVPEPEDRGGKDLMRAALRARR